MVRRDFPARATTCSNVGGPAALRASRKVAVDRFGRFAQRRLDFVALANHVSLEKPEVVSVAGKRRQVLHAREQRKNRELRGRILIESARLRVEGRVQFVRQADDERIERHALGGGDRLCRPIETRGDIVECGRELQSRSEVERRTGAVRVARVVAAVDAGQIVNPDGVINQIEGGIIQSISWTLKESVRFDRTRVVTRTWADYPIMRFADVPEVDVVLLDQPSERFLGVGEGAQGPTAAAVANAVANATGKRLRALPFTPERVRRALV